MKFLFPVALGLFVAGCSSLKPEPKPGTAAHQQWLHEQARAHFLSLKAQEQKSRPVAEPTPEPERVAFLPFFKRKPKPEPTPSPRLADFRARKPQPTPRLAETRPHQPDDTLYIWDAPRQREEASTQRFTKGEIRYARELAKPPENLTSEERLWARRRYR
jgi:hypothetical protein